MKGVNGPATAGWPYLAPVVSMKAELE